MERVSQILIRNRQRLAKGRVLLVNPPRDSLFRSLSADGRTIRISTQDYGDYCWLLASGAQAAFELLPEPDESIDSVVLTLPREKDRLSMMLHSIASWLPRQATLWLAGENRAGIKSAQNRLQASFSQVNRLDNARHCGLFEASGPLPPAPFRLAEYEQTWSLQFGGRTLEIHSLPGVFSHGRLDPGTRLLLDVLERLRPTGKILDFACGCGVVGAALASAGQTEVTLLDVSASALESSRLTLERNGLRAGLLPSDGLAQLSGRFDWIVSNPPFHRGIRNELDVAALFFRQAGTFLAQNGKIVIVCNRHLPYERWLRDLYDEVERLDENREFLVIRAGTPKKGKNEQ